MKDNVMHVYIKYVLMGNTGKQIVLGYRLAVPGNSTSKLVVGVEVVWS